MGSNPSTAYFHIMVHQPAAIKLRSLAKCSLDDSVRRLLYRAYVSGAKNRAERTENRMSGNGFFLKAVERERSMERRNVVAHQTIK